MERVREMNSNNHEQAQALIQAGMDRPLSGAEQEALHIHLSECQICQRYQRVHSRLQALGMSRMDSLAINAPSPNTVISTIKRGSKHQKRVRSLVRATRYSTLMALILLGGMWLLPGLPEPSPLPGAAVSGTSAGVQTDTSNGTTTPQASFTPAPTESPTPFARFNFGNVVSWEEVKYFRRAERDLVDAEAISGDPRREDGLTVATVQARASFDLLLPLNLPKDYAFERAWYEPSYDSVGVCYVGPVDERTFSRPRLCVREQPAPFQDFVGHSAEVHSMKIEGTDAEYVRGGWLSVSPAGASDSKYQWDDRMVPTTIVRFTFDGRYFGVSDIALDCSNPDPVCPETLQFAERLITQ
jgi:hypothetical protein